MQSNSEYSYYNSDMEITFIFSMKAKRQNLKIIKATKFVNGFII